MKATCPDCGMVLTSPFRQPSLGTHRNSKGCRERALARTMDERDEGSVPRVWRWILGPIGIKCDTSDALCFVPKWVATVVGVASAQVSFIYGNSDLRRLDAAAENAVKFIRACQKDMQLVEALAAAEKLGGKKAAATFMGEHEEYMRAFRGST